MLQKVILEQFDKKYRRPTYKRMVELTGIERTRLFRIKNGVSMRVDELDIFFGLISEEETPLKTYMDCYKFLDPETIEEIEREIKRKLILSKILKESK